MIHFCSMTSTWIFDNLSLKLPHDLDKNGLNRPTGNIILTNIIFTSEARQPKNIKFCIYLIVTYLKIYQGFITRVRHLYYVDT